MQVKWCFDQWPMWLWNNNGIFFGQPPRPKTFQESTGPTFTRSKVPTIQMVQTPLSRMSWKIQKIHSTSLPFFIRTWLQVWYFVTKINLTYCEKKLFYWSRKKNEIQGWRARICKSFEITRTFCSNSERSEQFLVTECFFNLFLEVSQT